MEKYGIEKCPCQIENRVKGGTPVYCQLFQHQSMLFTKYDIYIVKVFLLYFFKAGTCFYAFIFFFLPVLFLIIHSNCANLHFSHLQFRYLMEVIRGQQIKFILELHLLQNQCPLTIRAGAVGQVCSRGSFKVYVNKILSFLD